MIGKLKRHELRKIWRDEAADFTTWLEKNLDALSESIGIELALVKREHEVGPFSADIVATDEAGQKVIIENQLERTDHTHLGQIITYVSNLDGNTVIWISSQPRQEHINAVNWLNTQTQLNFYLLKIEAISIDDSKPAPLFQVICKPDEDIKSAAAAESELSEREKFYLRFWTKMQKACESKIAGFANRKPLPYPFYSKASGTGGLSFAFVATSKFHGIELYIDTTDAEVNESVLLQFKSHAQEIESEFGHKLEYDDLPEKRACRIRYVIMQGKDILDLDEDKVQAVMIETMIRFERAIKLKIKDLDFEIPKVA